MADQKVYNALVTLNSLIPLVEEAEKQFKGARTMGFLDIFGGGTLVDLVKHYKLNKAQGIMEEINSLLQNLQRELGGMNIPQDYRMEMNGFLTFADFVFDGFLVDAYMASKIMTSLDQVRKLKERLLVLKDKLEMMN